jgi:lysophospholipase L1-like esterase
MAGMKADSDIIMRVMKPPKMALTIILFLLVIAAGAWSYHLKTPQTMETTLQDGEIGYVAIGDSYTIGNGLREEERWPNLMTKRLNEAGIPVKLLANPAVSGYTVEDALVREVPVVERLKPDFVTVFIGANDNFRGTPPSRYETELKNLLDQIQSKLKNPQKIVLITIPDYSKSPASRDYNTTGVSQSIQEYNRIIQKAADQRGLKVADIFPVSQTMTSEADFISDGLHPSAQGTAKWEQVIYPVVLEKLKEK